MTSSNGRPEIMSDIRERFESLLRDGAAPSVLAGYLESLPAAAEQWLNIADSMYFDRLLEPTLLRHYTEKIWYNLIATATDRLSSRRWFIIRAVRDQSVPEPLRAMAFVMASSAINRDNWQINLLFSIYKDHLRDCLSEYFRIELCRKKCRSRVPDLQNTVEFGHAIQRSWTLLPPALSEAIENDQPARCEILRGISNKKMNTLLPKGVASNASKILCQWIGRMSEKRLRYSHREILFMACSKLERVAAAEVVEALEAKSPGLVRNTTDTLGNNALWHTIYYDNIPYSFRKQDQESGQFALRQLLIKHGADPAHHNIGGLSFQHVELAIRRVKTLQESQNPNP